MFNYLFLSIFHLYPKFKIAFDPTDNNVSELSGLNSIEVIQYPFFAFVKLDCK